MTAPVLTHDTLGNLQGGGIGYTINEAIRTAMKDCENRPGLDKARTVTIQLTFKPLLNKGLDGQAAFSTVAVSPQVNYKVPPQAGGPEFLHVAASITEDGERVLDAVFSQQGLFVQAPKEGN